MLFSQITQKNLKKKKKETMRKPWFESESLNELGIFEQQ